MSSAAGTRSGPAGAVLGRMAPRFDFALNRAAAKDAATASHRACYDAASYGTRTMRLAPIEPAHAAGDLVPALRRLADVTRRCSEAALAPAGDLLACGPTDLAAALRNVADCLARPRDRRRALLHAEALESGYSAENLAELAGEVGEFNVVAGDIETWFGKTDRRLPTSFAATRCHALEGPVTAAKGLEDHMRQWLRTLHSGLRMAPLPEFSPTQLVMMAGEGNSHPKHIAYFLPSDQGVSRSPHKRSYYFNNVHMALIEGASLPLARAHLDVGAGWPDQQSPIIASLGVFAHEAGHAVYREGNPLAPLNRADRWLSVTMQEIMADVFGVLLLTEVIGPALGHEPTTLLSYHLAECLRYVDRGLGCFADSDGMYFQLSYLASLGVLAPARPGSPMLRADPEGVLAGLRSLARVLADTVLAGDDTLTRSLADTFGPQGANPALEAYLCARSLERPISLDYEAVGGPGATMITAVRSIEPKAPPPAKEDGLFRFYCSPRLDDASGDMRTLYQIWEDQNAFNDSVTPSTYCDAYRDHLVAAIAQKVVPGGRIFSIGCGNAFVERDLVQRGYRVDGIDWNEEAVELARAKQIDAVAGDFLEMPSGSLAAYDGIYADGLLGHLYNEKDAIATFLVQLRRTAPSRGAWLIFSNDAPLDPALAAEPHPRVENFWLISRELLADALRRDGYDVVESYYFRYRRPISGERNRTICLARVTG